MGKISMTSHRQKPYSTLKSGQKQLDRDYYQYSTRNVPDGSGYVTNYKRFDSLYTEKQSKNVQPEDYKGHTIAKNLLSIALLVYTLNS